MAFCDNCGTRLNDGAKYCSKCGNTIGESNLNVAPHSSNISTEMTKLQKSGAGCVTILVGMALFSSLVQGNIISGVVAIAATVALVYLFMGKIEKKYAWVVTMVAFIGVFGVLAATTKDKPTTEQVSSRQKDVIEEHQEIQQKEKNEQQAKQQIDDEENDVLKEQDELHRDFFEKGYEYSASYRVQRKRGYGLSANYEYKIKIYNDGTTEIVEEIKGDEFTGHPSELYNCKIDKKSESYRDVAATWYEVTFNRSGKLFVDNNGNIIELHVNGNDKTIQEAITSGDCRFGKFSKSELNSSNVYRCRTCGNEYNPDKEAIVSEEYCYMDYPQQCSSCGKIYTVRKEGNGACKGTCASCYNKHRAIKTYEEVTGRKLY